MNLSWCDEWSFLRFPEAHRFSLPLCLLAKCDETIDEPIESHAFFWKWWKYTFLSRKVSFHTPYLHDPLLAFQLLHESKELLLKCATPDAVARLPSTHLAQQADELWTNYFTVQEHSSLTAFLRNVLTTKGGKSGKGSLIQVSPDLISPR